MNEPVELIIRNGRLITFDDAEPIAEALAIDGNTIVAVGSNGDIDNLQGPQTRIHDAQGHTVLPGFIESHMHLFGGAASLESLDLTGVGGEAALASAAGEFVSSHQTERLILAVGADYGIFGKGHETTRHDLDRVIRDRPFAMMAADAHTMWANTRALKLAGILHGGPVSEGSEIVLGEDGLASGELRETGAFGPVMAQTALGGRQMLGYVTGDDPDPPATPRQRRTDMTLIAKGLRHCARNGITSIHNMDGNFYQLELLDELDRSGDLLCRTQIPFHLKNYQPLERLEEAEEMRRRFCSDMLWSGRVKMFMDGVIESRTAFMLEPYPDKQDSVGDPLFSVEHFNEACIRSDALGLQISVHAIGDAAVRRTLDGYEAARNVNGTRDSRHRIEHIEALHPDDLPRFRKLDVIASTQPLHSPLGGFFDEPPPGVILREEQLPLSFAWQSIRDTGATLIFSTDWPVVPVEVMPSIKGAIATRELGRSWGNQQQSLADALAGYTRDGAYAEFSEHRKGRLKAGMLADIVVMSHDIVALAPESIDQACPVLTLCGGRVTYQA